MAAESASRTAPVSRRQSAKPRRRRWCIAGPMPETTDSHLLALRQALAGRYDVQAPIGRGGMGLVYLARELRLDRPVAIKLLPPDLAADAACRQRFLREARTAAALAHPNIVPIHSTHEVGEFVFFTMAYVAGETLAQRVAAGGPLAPEDAARLLAEVGEALAYAHARGEAVDARSDVYSLGVVAYYALSGRLPFDAATDGALLLLHITAPAPPLRAAAPAIPVRLAQVVDRCLAKDPWARFPDVARVVRAIVDAVEPPRAPLAVRAFLMRGANRGLIGFALLPVAALAWLHSGDLALRAAATAACATALLVPVLT